MTHPLLNKFSLHYSEKGKKSAIQEFEEEHDIFELIAWAKLTIKKYKYRKDKKGQKESDLEKIETYQNYLNLLTKIYDDTFGQDVECPMEDTYKMAGIVIEYELKEDSENKK